MLYEYRTLPYFQRSGGTICMTRIWYILVGQFQIFIVEIVLNSAGILESDYALKQSSTMKGANASLVHSK